MTHVGQELGLGQGGFFGGLAGEFELLGVALQRALGLDLRGHVLGRAGDAHGGPGRVAEDLADGAQPARTKGRRLRAEHEDETVAVLQSRTQLRFDAAAILGMDRCNKSREGCGKATRHHAQEILAQAIHGVVAGHRQIGPGAHARRAGREQVAIHVADPARQLLMQALRFAGVPDHSRDLALCGRGAAHLEGADDSVRPVDLELDAELQVRAQRPMQLGFHPIAIGRDQAGEKVRQRIAASGAGRAQAPGDIRRQLQLAAARMPQPGSDRLQGRGQQG